MSDPLPPAVERAFERHGDYERVDGRYRLTTTAFESRVGATDLPDGDVAYTLIVRTPSLRAATVDEIGDAVAEGWFETLELRLEDAPKATRTTVSLAGFSVERDDDEVLVTYQYELPTPERAADVTKAFVEYVEGTYVEGVVPGYEYVQPVADLVGEARSDGADGRTGGTPL